MMMVRMKMIIIKYNPPRMITPSSTWQCRRLCCWTCLFLLLEIFAQSSEIDGETPIHFFRSATLSCLCCFFPPKLDEENTDLLTWDFTQLVFWQVGTLLAPYFFSFDLHVLRLVVFGARIRLRCIAAIARDGDPRCFCRT